MGSVAVPQHVVDEIRNSVYASKQVRPEGYLAKSSDGRYTWNQMSERDSAERQKFLESILEMAESFERIPSYHLLDTDETEILVNLLGEHGVGAIFASSEVPELSSVLVTDDLGLAKFARSFDRSVVNTQHLLQEFNRSRVITEEVYADGIEGLVLLNYDFVQVRTEDIIQRLEANSFMTSPGTLAMLKTLEGPNCSSVSAVSVGAELIAALVRKAPPSQVKLILPLVLVNLQRGRDAMLVLFQFRHKIASIPQLHPKARTWIISTVDLYIRL